MSALHCQMVNGLGLGLGRSTILKDDTQQILLLISTSLNAPRLCMTLNYQNKLGEIVKFQV